MSVPKQMNVYSRYEYERNIIVALLRYKHNESERENMSLHNTHRQSSLFLVFLDDF